MRYAIDRFTVGTEKEVCADEFYGLRYIPNKLSRFRCPECGEIVYFRSKGGNQPNHFYHKVKTDQTPECDKRVDGHANLSLYQRVGLSLYLTGVIDGNLKLNIGFPALGRQLLMQAETQKLTIKIVSDAGTKIVKRIDSSNFYEDRLTLVPVNFVPKNSKNYNLEISGTTMLRPLLKHWADFADGFAVGGALFSFEDAGGKKVRRGDCISTQRTYYLVTKFGVPPYNEIKSKEIGKLSLKDITYKVFEIEIVVTLDNKSRFIYISDYFSRFFGVVLLEKQPELIPLWPPVVNQDAFIPVRNDSSVVCYVSSGNALPNVYQYKEFVTRLVDLHRSVSGGYITEVTVGRTPAILSVDRKYVGREIVFQEKPITKPNFSYAVQLERQNHEITPLDKVTGDILSSDFSLTANSKMELYLGNKTREFRCFSIRKDVTDIPGKLHTNEMYLIVESGVLFHIKAYSDSYAIVIEDKELAESLSNCFCGQMVPIPMWAYYNIRLLKRNGYIQTYHRIMTSIRNNEISVALLKMMRKPEFMRIVVQDKLIK